MRHSRCWSLDASFAPAGRDDEMDDYGDESSPTGRWPAEVESRPLAVKTPSWLRSLTLHHQRYRSRRSDNAASSEGRLPKLGATNGDDAQRDESSDTEFDAGTGSMIRCSQRRSTAAHRFAKLSRIVLPPLGAHEPAESSPAGSWLLPIVPSAQRREAYRNVREQRKQFSAQTNRLPPIPLPSSPSGPSLSAPLQSSKGLMELHGSSPAGKARDDDTRHQQHTTGTPLAALPRGSKARRGAVTQEASEKPARIAPGAEEPDDHLRSADAVSTAGHRDEALASRQVAADTGAASLPFLAAGSRSGGSAGPPVARRPPPSDHQATTAVHGRRSREPSGPWSERGAAVSSAGTTAATSNKQGRPPAVRWTVEWTDGCTGSKVRDEDDRAPDPLSLVGTAATEATTATAATTGAESTSRTEADGPERPVVVMASPTASRRSAERQFRSAGRVRRSPPPPPPAPPASAAEAPEQPLSPRSRSPPVPAVLARQRARTAHPSLAPASSFQSSAAPGERQEHDDDEIIDNIRLHDLELNDSSPERSPARRAESIKQPSGGETTGDGDDDDEEGEHRNGTNASANGERASRSTSVEHLDELLNNNQLDEPEEPKLVPASSPAFRRRRPERIVHREEHCLPNAVRNPDDRPAFVGSGSGRYVDYADDFDEEDEAFGGSRDHFESSLERVLAEEEYEEEDDDDGVHLDARLEAPHRRPAANSTASSPSRPSVRLGSKSRSLASFAGRSSPADDFARRHRSLPVRRLDSSSERTANGAKRSGTMMPSRRKPAVRTRSPPVTNFRTPPDTLDPKTGLQMALKGIHSPEWEEKLEGLRRLNELLAGYSDNLTHEIHTIALALLVEVKNLRSQVSRAAIRSLGNMFQHCGKHMDQDLDRSVSLLLNKTSDTNRFIRDDAHAALVNVTEYVSAPKAIAAITAEGLTHKNGTVRAEAAKLLAAIVVRLGPARALCGAKDVTERILPAAAHFIQDGSLEARGQAKIVFSVMIKDPVFDKALVKYLSPAVLRNIQRTLDVLRKNPQQF